MPRESRPQSANTSSWWLLGEEHCEHCHQEYTLTLEYRCIECDGPVCPHCVVVVEETTRVVCPKCQPPPRKKPEKH